MLSAEELVVAGAEAVVAAVEMADLPRDPEGVAVRQLLLIVLSCQFVNKLHGQRLDTWTEETKPQRL
jgi:hypothetical protein